MSKKAIFAILLAVIVAFGAYTLTSNNESTQDTETTQISEEVNNKVSYVGVAGQTALETLKATAEVETQTYDFGEFVTSINGVQATDGENFWAFYVDGQQANIGADQFIATGGEAIEWILEDIEL